MFGQVWKLLIMVAMSCSVIVSMTDAALTQSTVPAPAYQDAIESAQSVMMADPTEALALAELAEALAAEALPEARDMAFASAWWLQSEALTRVGRAEDAFPLAAQALDRLGEAPTATKLLADIYTSLGRIEKVLGQHGAALDHYQKAYEIYRELGDRRSESIALQSMASIYTDAQQYDRAVEYFQNALDRYQDNSLVLAAHNNMANALTQLGRFEEAETSFAEAIELAQRMESPILEARILNNLANMEIEASDLEAAEAAINTAFQLVADDGTFEWIRFFWGVRAQIAFGRGDSLAAVRFLAIAFSGVNLETTSQNYAEMHGSAAEIYAAHGDWSLAYDHLTAFKRLSDERARFAASTNTALVGAQFDFAEQELEIEQLRSDSLEQELALAQSRQSLNLIVALLVGAFGVIITVFLVARARAVQAKARALSEELYTDVRSGLPTSAALERDLAKQYEASEQVAVLAIALARQKHLEGALGHTAYGKLEIAVSERLSTAFEAANPYRLSPGLFGLLVPAPDMEAAQSLAQAIARMFETPVTVDGVTIDVSVICGVARDTDVDVTIKQAHLAINQARRNRLSFAVFDAEMYGDPAASLSLMSEMRLATERGDMKVFYQPKLNVRRGRFEGVEALCRWFHPERGYISPDQFIPQAEETGHIRALTEWVLTTSIEDQRRLVGQGLPISVAVNVSGAVLSDRDFARKAQGLIVGAAGPVTLEITETAIMANPDLAIENLNIWRESGAKISIDDYGTGQSSLAYLQTIPSDELKLDRQFVSNLDKTARGRMLIKSTVDLAHNLGLELVAEGVETETELAVLKLLGCDWIQGFLLSKPIAADALVDFLRQHQPGRSQDRRGSQQA
jgi:EAL domain-containing protein (putative c-di-GMP-specific phosphodiesterase class I)/tetratricopeptide (TPR) repeat protein